MAYALESRVGWAPAWKEQTNKLQCINGWTQRSNLCNVSLWLHNCCSFCWSRTRCSSISFSRVLMLAKRRTLSCALRHLSSRNFIRDLCRSSRQSATRFISVLTANMNISLTTTATNTRTLMYALPTRLLTTKCPKLCTTHSTRNLA